MVSFWNSHDAKFESSFLRTVAALPALVVAVILTTQLLGLAIRWRIAPFVEEVAKPATEETTSPCRRSRAFLALLLAATAGGGAVSLVVPLKSGFSLEIAALPAAWLATIGLLLALRPRTIPFAVLTIFSLLAVVHLILLQNAKEPYLTIAAAVAAAVGAVTTLFMPFRDERSPAKDISQPGSEPTSALRSPEDNLSLWQFLTVSWISPLLHVGSKRQLEDEDVWQLPYEFQHKRLHENFHKLKGTVVQRLLKANAIDLVILTILGLLELVMMYSAPVLLQLLLSSMEDFTAPKRAAITYAALSMTVRLIQAQSGVISLWFGRRCYERSRGEMITMLFKKTLDRKSRFVQDGKVETNIATENGNGRVGNGVAQQKEQESWWQQIWRKLTITFKQPKAPEPIKEPASMGKILNLMRNDVYEVAQRFWEFQAIIQKPLSVIFAVTLVVRFLGWPSLLAVAAILVAQVLNVLLARIMVHFEKKRRVATDNKLKVISQFVEAIRHLRWYGWQGAWLTQIMSARQTELTMRVVVNCWNLAIALINTLALDLTPVIAFFAYTIIAGKSLTVDVAFPAMQLFQLFNMALRDLPQLIIVLINAYVAVGRIEDFMAEAEKQETSANSIVSDELWLDRGAFAWPGTTRPVLRHVNISFPKGLTVVYGEVASGKTALLLSLLEELDQLEGWLSRPHTPIGYCAQSPWLQSMSIRENILFGAPYVDIRYKTVLLMCCLTEDLADFKAGDLSLVGENGIGLSGGQRARIALARALYSDAGILLLDDPFAALDQQTAEQVAENIFKTLPLCANPDTSPASPLFHIRIIVCVTHRLDLVNLHAKQMIEVENGTARVIPRELGVYGSFRPNSDVRTLGENEIERIKQNNALAVPEKLVEKFVEDERRAQGGVKASVYWQFIKAGKLKWWALLISVLTLHRCVSIFEAWYLKSWGEAYKTQQQSFLIAQDEFTLQAKTPFFDGLPPPDENTKPWLIGFLLIALGKSVTFVLYQGVIMVITYVSGKTLFGLIMERVAGATFRYYDVTPVGRLMNRMTSDMGVIDGNISMQLQAMAWLTVSWVSSIAVIASVTPTFLLFSALLTIVFVLIFRRFIPTSQSLRRLEMVSLTPLMSNFGSLLDGLITVRAFRVQEQFQQRVVRVVDTFQKMDHFYWSLQAWLMYRYDMLSAVSTFLITLLALGTNISAGLTAFVLIAANKLVSSTHLLCKSYGQLQMQFVSVERVIELLHLDQEPKGKVSPPAWWPSFSGDIVFDSVVIKYAPHLDPALAGISFTVKGGSKIAVIGRTGSGKSTLALSMLATVAPEAGQILVDNIDLAEVDKQLLRTKVTFLAQDPVLFPGTMRQNLDPVNEHTDNECSHVLERVCSTQYWELETMVEAGGRNLSQGQRQLVGLARAVLRRSAIIILDEATASIDRETAMQIQRVMHEELRDSTVITIAHRLEAVRKADYCIVLGKGRILRQGPAAEMLESQHDDMIDDEA